MAAQSARFLTCILAASLLCSTALRLTQAPPPPSKQTLVNVGDLQYMGNFSVGGQNLTGLFDTGSFEILLFNRDCSTCGTAAKYSQETSPDYAPGEITVVQSYGSGDCSANDAYDKVASGEMGYWRQAIWVASQCNMPVLEAAAFSAIVGLGPPGEPVLEAKNTIKQLDDIVKEVEASGNETPAQVRELMAQTQHMLRVAETKTSMLENFRVTAFSACFGRAKGSPGVLVWNDETSQDDANVIRVPVVGDIYWSVAVKDIALDGAAHSQVMGCEEGCAAIVDTGTSLMAVPTGMYESMFSYVDEFMVTQLPASATADCSDLSGFPDLVLNVGAEKLRLPPSAYIGSYASEPSEQLARFVRTKHLRNGCQLLIMDMGAPDETQQGPLIILGMPFFREYYTTFDLGAGDSANRQLILSKPGGDDCDRTSKHSLSAGREHWAHEYAYQPRKLNPAKLRVPKTLHRHRRI